MLNQLKVEHGLPALRLQVGIPGPFDIALLCWAHPLRHYQAEVDAALREVDAIDVLTDQTAVYQLELPLETVITARVPPLLRPGIARRLAARAADFVAHAPSGSTWIVHLCVGDPHGAPFSTLTDARPLVELANALATQWPGGRTLEAMHLPLGDGKHPAPVDAAYYAPLADLTLPETVHVSAGLAHAGAHLDDQLMAVPTTMERLVALANATV